MRCLSPDSKSSDSKSPDSKSSGSKSSGSRFRVVSLDQRGKARSLSDWVLLALVNTVERRRLLQHRSLLRDILNDVSVRRLLFERAVLPASSTAGPTTDPIASSVAEFVGKSAAESAVGATVDAQSARALIVDIMKCSRMVWRGGMLSAQIYDEALAQTWVWFIDKLPTYDPEKASFTTWFNYKLKWMIVEESRRALPIPHEDKPIDAVSPDPYAWENLLAEWVGLVQRDQQLRQCRMQGNLQLSCQRLLLSILMALQETGVFSWEAIAQHQGIKPDVLKRFCRRRCFARFKELTSE